MVAADIDETPLKGELPRDYARRLAREKADAAACDESFVLVGNQFGDTLLDLNFGVGTILNDDPGPTLAISGSE